MPFENNATLNVSVFLYVFDPFLLSNEVQTSTAIKCKSGKVDLCALCSPSYSRDTVFVGGDGL